MSDATDADRDRATWLATYMACDCDFGIDAVDKRFLEITFREQFMRHRLAAKAEARAECARELREESMRCGEKAQATRRQGEAENNQELVDAADYEFDLENGFARAADLLERGGNP